MSKRRFLSLLPGCNQTADLKAFFGATVDQLFQPGRSDNISGYIGQHIDDSAEAGTAGSFYLAEPDQTRNFYQLEPGMISLDPATNTILNALTYPDFIAYLADQGAIVSDQQRLFETSTYSWAPPINIDAWVNYRQYYWFGDGPDELPVLAIFVPIATYTGDGTTTTFALPAPMASINAADETPSGYVDGQPVSTGLSSDGLSLVFAHAPGNGLTVQVTRVDDFVSTVTGMTSIDVSGLTANDADPGHPLNPPVTHLTSGMLLHIYDTLHLTEGWSGHTWDSTVWDGAAYERYIVEGVGQSIRFVPYENMIRGLSAQYTTIDRSSKQINDWSKRNLWVHRAACSWSGQDFFARQAVRPIIEFVRDLVLWECVAPLYKASASQATTLVFAAGLPVSTTVDGFALQIGVSGQGMTAPIALSNIVASASTNVNLASAMPKALLPFEAGAAMTFRQIWSEDAPPLFMLYDLATTPVALNDATRYPASTFYGNRLFGYALGSGLSDPVIRQPLVFDENDNIVYSNDIALTQYSAGLIPIDGIYQYGINSTTDPRQIAVQSTWHAIGITTQSIDLTGFWNIPINLQANPLSQEVTSVSNSNVRQHFNDLIGQQTNFTGSVSGLNNYRDSARDLSLGTQVLQHQACLLKAMLLASNSKFDPLAALRYADQEYNRFRNKFLRKASDLYRRGIIAELDGNDWVAMTLNALKIGHTNAMPFAYSTMGGGQWFIPPSPAGLGLQPASPPAKYLDYMTSPQGILFIQGHDGSRTPGYNDWRDDLLLGLEQLIYDNLDPALRTEALPAFDIRQWCGGRFYAPLTGYTRDEVAALLAPFLEVWAQNNGLDFRAHTDYDATNPYTWNYRGSVDRFGLPMAGNWRGVYRDYYGTEAPHLRPWEMLGFNSQPSWWELRYGQRPYAASNPFWQDARDGFIIDGVRRGYDYVYARPELMSVLPVDSLGQLRDPVSIGLISMVPARLAAAPWQAGDCGPVELFWRNSPAFRFALASISFLMKPARFTDVSWAPLARGFIGDQWVDLASRVRSNDDDNLVHGETDANGNPTIVSGLSQWIADYMVSQGVSSTRLGAAVRGLSVRLLHPMAGFVSSAAVRLISDSYGLLPAENVQTVLYTLPLQDTEVYSGVIIEWTGSGWRVVGYDSRKPIFSIIPPDPAAVAGAITLANAVQPKIEVWHPNTWYAINTFVDYKDSVYQCQRSHTSGPGFELAFWTPRSDMSARAIAAPRIITYARGLDVVQPVAYGTVFASYQEVGDFLLGYERYLESRGWRFEDVDPSSGSILNWSMACFEFLSWTQVKWQAGNFIALSPGQRRISFSTLHGMINDVEDSTTGFFGLCDRVGAPIDQTAVLLNRLDGDLTITALNTDIFLARLYLSTIEHLLVIDNETIFNDAIYLPLFNLRQPRLQLICNRAQDWSGRLDAPGFVITGNALASNFDKAANDVRYMFDIELADVANLRDYARHVIGYSERAYLDKLLLAEVEQFEFYQCAIQQKGAPGVFQKLMRNVRASANSNLSFLEEWAFQIGEYGAPADAFVSFALGQTDTRDDPQLITFQPITNGPLNWIMLSPDDARWHDRPVDPVQFFAMRQDYRPPVLPSAGPVRLTDVSSAIFALSDLPNVFRQALRAGYPPLPTGQRVWVYERDDRSFTVMQSFDSAPIPNPIVAVVAPSPGTMDSTATTRLIMREPLTLHQADVGRPVVIDAPSLSAPDLQGLAVITAISFVGNSIDIDIISSQGYVYGSTDLAPVVRVLREVRFADMHSLLVAGHAFSVGDLAWIDGSPSTPWTVVRWDGQQWSVARQQPYRTDPSVINETVIYAAGTRMTGKTMSTDAPVLGGIDVIDPMAGLVAGVARKELDYMTPFDPARYNAGTFAGALNIRGPNEVGRVWWDISTVKFLDPLTDTLGQSDDRDAAELDYRNKHWAEIAPNSQVDVFEWIESLVDPNTYAAQAVSNTSMGTVYLPDAASWVERVVYDPAYGDILKFYFWVGGLATIPVSTFRTMSVASVTAAITNPIGAGVAWTAPISANALLISGVAWVLNDSDTVLKVRQRLAPDLAGRHDQWSLMRKNDPASLPSAQLWQHLRDSLTGFIVDTNGTNVLPAAQLPPRRAVGIRPGQNMFQIDGPLGRRSGLLDARLNFVSAINAIFAATAMTAERTAVLPTLNRSDPPSPLLQWIRVDDSYPLEPPPPGTWDVQVFSMTERNNLLARSDFIVAGNLLPDAPGRIDQSINVLVNTLTSVTPQWSIWRFDGLAAHRASNSFQAANPSASKAEIIDYLVSNADGLFTLAPSYTVAVGSEADRDDLTSLKINDRVLVQPSNGFWAIWLYNGPGVAFTLVRAQRYNLRIADADDTATDVFIRYADYYAPGYSADKPPVMGYATIAARNASEGDAPVNRLVLIKNDGSGRFIWTQFNAGLGWSTVAIQNGTLQLTNAFYDSQRVVESPTWLAAGLEVIAPTDVSLRDGSWEMRNLLDALRYGGVLQDSEINTLWFNMVDFVHAQQNDVEWAFKTSFMSIVGYNVPLLQSPFTQNDQSDNLFDFIDEVKPYRVKVRGYATNYNTPHDTATVRVLDYDKPVFYDVALDRYRVLDPANSTDVAILQTGAWANWYANYQTTLTAITNAGTAASASATADGDSAGQIALAVATAQNTAAAASLDRHVMVTILFDRVVGSIATGGWDGGFWDINNWDNTDDEANNQSGAVYRIARYYEPTADMPKDFTALMNLQFKGGWVDGFVFNPGDFPLKNYPTTGWDSNSETSTTPTAVSVSGTGFTSQSTDTVNPTVNDQPRHLGLRDPVLQQEHPEERVQYAADDALQLVVSALPKPGAPPMEIRSYAMPALSAPTVFPFTKLAQSAIGVMVYCNGLRAAPDTDYTVDHFGRTVTVNATIQGTPVTAVTLHVFGFGGLSAISDTQFLTYGTNPLTLGASSATANVAVIVNGTPLSGGYTVSGTSVTLTAPPAAGTDVALITYSGAASQATSVQRQVLTYNSGRQWTLSAPDTATVPAHAGTIVEVNGARLTPPTTFYGALSPQQPWMYLPTPPLTSSDITIYYDGVRYAQTVPICFLTSPSSPYPFGLLVPTGQTPNPVSTGQFVVFQNMIVPLDATFSSTKVSAVVSVPGRTPDYTVVNNVLTIASTPLTIWPSGSSRTLTGSDSVVVTTFSNAGSMDLRTACYPVAGINSQQTYLLPARVPVDAMIVTMNGLILAPDTDYQIVTTPATVPSITIMLPALAISDQTSGYVVMTTFTAAPAAEALSYQYATRTPSYLRMQPALTASGAQQVNLSNNPVFLVDDGFNYGLRTSAYSGVLHADIADQAATIVVDLNTSPLTGKLQPTDPLPLPTDKAVGVVWIGSERIEYFSAVRVGQQITLGQLRRGTNGTSFGPSRLIAAGAGTGAASVYTLATTGLAKVTVDGTLWPPTGYSLSTSGTTTTITLTAPLHAKVRISVTNTATHLAGATVYAGHIPYEIPALPASTVPPIARNPPGLFANGAVGTIVFPRLDRGSGILGVWATGVVMDESVLAVKPPPISDSILGRLPLGAVSS